MWPELLVPREGLVDFKIFSGGDNARFLTYTRPAGAKMFMGIAVSGAGGGGGGFSRGTGGDGGGGGGGSSGQLARIVTAWDALPSTLYCVVGAGGAGAAAGALGTSGAQSIISVIPVAVSASRLILLSGSQIPAGGAGGTGSAAGGGGASNAVSSPTSHAWNNFGIWVAIAGQSGAAGGAHTGAVGANITWGSSGFPLSSGAGGAGSTGTDFAGGNITGAGLVPTILGGQNAGDAGAGGFISWKPFMMTGGSGGASNDAATGGIGGDGAPGCGGGGGGAGTTGGAGGKGGDGLIILVSW